MLDESTETWERRLGEMLGPLRAEPPDPACDLWESTFRGVQAEILAREFIDLATRVFVLNVCAPLLDLVVGRVVRSAREDR